jgi:hypothetical protein
MFTSLISHSKLRAKGAHYDGLNQVIRLNDTKEEIAFTPEISNLPNFLEVEDEDGAARQLANVAAHSLFLAKAIEPKHKVSLYELHQIFGHPSEDALREIVKSLRGIEIVDSKRFNCEACLLRKSQRNYSKRQAPRASRSFEKIHIDLIGPISEQGINGERH